VSNEEILEKLLEFGEHLSKGTIFIDVFRTIGWFFVLGLAWFIDQLENITDLILGLKLFYNHPEFVEFVEKFQPILVILFAFNILFIGYLLIFQKEFNRAGVFTNVVMALIIVVLLGSGMSQAERFSSDAIDAINYEEGGNSTLSNTIIRDNITDVSLFDLDGWQTPELEDKNRIQSNFTRDININSYLTEGSDVTADQKLSDDGEDILGHKIETLGDGSRAVVELESGNWITDITQEYYYRYTLDWINMLGTLLVVGVVLITVAIKLAKLFFELAFNYILALFVAPSDMHSGQRMKQVVQNILNIFLVTIMIFLSLKVYMIGTEFLGEYLDGIPYLIAMIGFALAVIDGPNIVERLFGIDAGVKSGWGALAGSYAAAKGAAGLGKGMGKGALAAAKGARSAASKSASAGGFLSGAARGMMGDGQSDGKKGNAAGAAGNKANAQGKGQGATGHAGQGEAQGNGNSEGNQNEEQVNSLHNAMANANKNTKNENGSTRPTSLHDQMKNRSVAGTNGKGTLGSKANGTSGGVAGAGNRGNKTTGSPQTASVNDQNAQSTAKTGFPNDIEQAFDQVASTEEGSETINVTDQKQAGGVTNGKQGTSGSSSGNAARTTSGGGTSSAGGSTSGSDSGGETLSGGRSGSSNTKTPSVKNSQRVSSNVSQNGKEMIEEQNEVMGDSTNGGTIEQERRASTNHQQGSSGQQVVSQAVSSAGMSGGAKSGGGTSSGSTSGAASSTSGGSSSGGGAKTSSVRNSQRVSTNVGQTGKEMIEELNEVIEDSSGGGIIEQEGRTSTNHRQGSSSGQQTVRKTPSSGGTTTSGGSSGSVTSGGTSSDGTSGSSGSATRTGGTSSGSGGTKTSTVSHTTHVTNDIDNSAHEKEVIQENNEVIQEDRHLGQIMKDTVSQRFHSTKTVKNTKRNYQVGRNTGQAIKRNFKKNFTRKK
jgi:hypothetical protein